MPRERTTKGLAKRIALDYFNRPHPLRSWKSRLNRIGALAGAGLAMAVIAGPAARALVPGAVSPAHAFFENDCARCHAGSRAASFLLPVREELCSRCHEGAIHNDAQQFVPSCTECHAEHRGVRLATVRDAACTRCHAALTLRSAAVQASSTEPGRRVATRVISFSPGGHPEFFPLRDGGRDASRIRLNHEVHLRKDLRGPKGPVALTCSSCHAPEPGGERMAPVNYRSRCAPCHPLGFDYAGRFAAGSVAPHEKPEAVRAFLTRVFSEEIARRPSRLGEADPPPPAMPEDAGRRPPGRDAPPPSAHTPQEWVWRQVAIAETVLFRKDCRLCHETRWSSDLPEILQTAIPAAWLPRARFDHRSHRLLACAACHAGAPRSEKTSDVLVPSISSCQQCHHPGGARADCALCHLYHDRTRERPFEGGFELPLRASR